MAEVLRQYTFLSQRFDVLDDTTVAFDQLMRKRDAVARMAAYVDDSVKLSDLTFTLVPSEEGRNRLPSMEGKEVVVLSPWALVLGSHTFVIVVAVRGILDRIGERDGAIEYRIGGAAITRADRLAAKGTLEEFPLWELITDASYAVGRGSDSDHLLIADVGFA